MIRLENIAWEVGGRRIGSVLGIAAPPEHPGTVWGICKTLEASRNRVLRALWGAPVGLGVLSTREPPVAPLARTSYRRWPITGRRGLGGLGLEGSTGLAAGAGTTTTAHHPRAADHRRRRGGVVAGKDARDVFHAAHPTHWPGAMSWRRPPCGRWASPVGLSGSWHRYWIGTGPAVGWQWAGAGPKPRRRCAIPFYS